MPLGMLYRQEAIAPYFLHSPEKCHAHPTEQRDVNVAASDWPQVMVVEDDEMISETLEIALESRDYRVLGPVATLEEAYQLLETSKPDIALIDYRLAATTTEGLLASLNARQVPVCVLTGMRADELPVAFAGCAVLQKPFRLNTLLDALKQVRPG